MRDLLSKEPAILLQAPRISAARVLARIKSKHTAGTLIFEEQCSRSETGVLLYRAAEPAALIASILSDAPLCLALARSPFITTGWTESKNDLISAFLEACAKAHAAGELVKLSAPASLRRILLEAVLNSANARCLATTLETRTFVVAATKLGQFFYAMENAKDDELPAYSFLHGRSFLAAIGIKRINRATPAEHGKAFAKLTNYSWTAGLEAALRAASNTSSSCSCIDIGASPGGWSDLLSRYYNRVIAIDPGEIDAAVAERNNVHHLRLALSAEDGGTSLAALCAAMLPAEQSTLVVCDANIPAADAANLLRLLASKNLLAIVCKIVLPLMAPMSVLARKGESRGGSGLGRHVGADGF